MEPVDSRATHSPETSFRQVASVESPRRSSLSFQIPRALGSSIIILRTENSRNDNRNFTFKIDHQLTSNHRLSGAWNDGLNTDSGPVAVLPHPVSATRNGVLGPAQKTLRLSHDWVITPTIVNHLSAGHTRQYQRLEAEEQGGNWAQQLGITGVANGAFPAINCGVPRWRLGLGPESGAADYRLQYLSCLLTAFPW